MAVDKCCFFVSLRKATFTIFTLDFLYGLIFAIISIARQPAFSVTFGSPGVLWISVLLHFAYAFWSLFGIYLIVKASGKWLVRIPTFYMIACGSMGFLQFLLLVVSGVFRSSAVLFCQVETQWSNDTCSTAITVAYAFLGLSYVVWTGLHVYFWFVVQAFSLKMESRLRYSALKDAYLTEWDNQMDMNGGHLPRSGSVKSAYSVI
ncbi:uncharacterized protein BX664DRAFT_343349 [Halteromyces radiatus]|uniref:uncharacterized protein n=1 Tax=Halteromyces radiatus TaxID=101107 RepID=UPI00221FCE25|nr:uncharacterized protein BX664DRAFT_343349 [Halteromyces radiatus]KAI8077727.1 hypothetical protein BX664DRAFT_343349 [Halteromyces radiatus]